MNKTLLITGGTGSFGHAVLNRFMKSDNFIATDYEISNTSHRVVKLILGNTKLSNKWWGIE
jgi:FlaA1/EpsC-like NDP-sugar epimerase